MSLTTETYLPRLLEVLERDPSAAERLRLDCGMCHEEMTTDGVDMCELPNGEPSLTHVAYILPCGHIFGLSCVVELMHHCLEQHVYGSRQNRCPTCRQRQHFIPCGCPHILGTVLRVEEASRKVILDRIKKIECMCDRCFSCELIQLAYIMTEEVDPSGGVDTEDGPDWQDPQTGEQLMMKIVFLKQSWNPKWQIDAFRTRDRLYAPCDMHENTRRRLDDFIDEMAPVYFASNLESGEGVHRIVAEIFKLGTLTRTSLTQL
ncbi:hypothetical protein FPOAC2_07824 [Fusarium poae]|jgi:hypothetical protein|uniref:RING-type domain-containing protein n=1 Tax=Fusarium poae TaxID=36050 RepID=A0A1B8AJK5_FUSPO|nr:hypothetical protein FPOAC1_007916 [Fusarium poae]KAG8668533.1 hypothetical protein FPOAC1_007916 [Fusarium poae]OBS20773.1 hypothetical protein FPOA_07113 [Fusarium poae]